MTFLTIAAALAQGSGGRSHGYAFGAIVFVPQSGFTRWDGTFGHAGAGGEAAIGRYVTAGGELGVLFPASNTFAQSTGLLTAGASVHPSGSGERVDTFLSGGAGALVSGGSSGVAYFGGGVNYWMRERIGLRVEYRQHFTINTGSVIHFAGIRFGVAFR